MKQSDAKTTGRAIPLFSAVAALMSLLTAAAGPFSQTVKVVRVDSATPENRTGDFELEISAIDLAPKPEDTSSKPKQQTHSQSAPEKSAKIVQPLSGHWESAAQIDLPVADVPAATPLVSPTWIHASSTDVPNTAVVSSHQAPIKAGRAPPYI